VESATGTAQPPLTGVTLHGGIFEVAMRNNIRYLLESYTLDDLLLQFRQRAGKPIPQARESPINSGSRTLPVRMPAGFLWARKHAAVDNDTELRDRMEALVAGIAECQQPNGYVMAYPKTRSFIRSGGIHRRG